MENAVVCRLGGDEFRSTAGGIRSRDEHADKKVSSSVCKMSRWRLRTELDYAHTKYKNGAYIESLLENSLMIKVCPIVKLLLLLECGPARPGGTYSHPARRN